MSEHTWRELERADMDTAAAHRFDEERMAAMTDNRTALLPCPFCGGIANTLHKPHVIDMRYSVGCNDDECLGFIGLSWLYKTEAEAIEAWNTRAEMSHEDALILLDELGLSERTCENTDTDEDSYFRCSVCDMSTLTEYMSSGYGLPHYCPNCGAKVVGE